MPTEESITLNLTSGVLAQVKAQVAATASIAQDDHPEGAAIRRQVHLTGDNI